MKKLLSLVLLSSLLLACQGEAPAPDSSSTSEPMPVDIDGGIGDGSGSVSVETPYECQDVELLAETRQEELRTAIEPLVEGSLYDLRSICESDEDLYVSVATQNPASQQILQLSPDFELLQSTPAELIKRTAGDLVAARIGFIEGETLYFGFYHGDGPCSLENHYELDLSDWSYEEVSTFENCDEDAA